MLKYLLALTFLLWPSPAAGDGGDGGLVNLPGGGSRQSMAPMEPGGWEVMIWTGNEYVVGIHNGETVAAKMNFEAGPTLLYLATLDGIDNGGSKWKTTWVCKCCGDTHVIETPISTRYLESDLRNHDRKVEAAKERHPKMPPPKPLPLPPPPKTGKAPPPDPRVGGQVLTPSELRQVTREEHNQSRNLPPDAGGRLGLGAHDRTTKTILEHNRGVFPR